MNKLAVAVISTFIVLISYSFGMASDGMKYGVGVSVTDDGGMLHFPVKYPVNDKWIVFEPTVGFMSQDTERKYISSGNTEKSDIDSKSIGFGVYYEHPVSSETSCLLGLRYAYLSLDVDTEIYEFKNDQDGYEIAPVLGLEYNFNEHIALGGYISLVYTSYSGSYQDTDNPAEDYDFDVDEFETDSRLFVKFYF